MYYYECCSGALSNTPIYLHLNGSGAFTAKVGTRIRIYKNNQEVIVTPHTVSSSWQGEQNKRIAIPAVNGELSFSMGLCTVCNESVPEPEPEPEIIGPPRDDILIPDDGIQP